MERVLVRDLRFLVLNFIKKLEVLLKLSSRAGIESSGIPAQKKMVLKFQPMKYENLHN